MKLDLSPYQALRDQRTFNQAPLLHPAPEEITLAEEALNRARDKLPETVSARLESRRELLGHPVRPLRYYPFPITTNPEEIEALFRWGRTYASIIRKVLKEYLQPRSPTKRFYRAALTRFLPPHLQELLSSYRTTDHLAGAHLGDDNINRMSIEWNLGAVGGLDEGFLVSKEVAPHIPPGLSPVEEDPVLPFRSALRHAYESHCLANGITPSPSPLMAFVEHDDIYGSTLSLCQRLHLQGERTCFCFDHELVFRDHLETASGSRVDILCCDLHLEDLSPGHPILRALAENKTALDCSPLARLILRSKATLALLTSPGYQKTLNLTPEELQGLRSHLPPTSLWSARTFRSPPPEISAALSALSRDRRIPAPESKSTGSPSGPMVVKVAIGGVFGGSAVAVSAPDSTRPAAELILSHLRPLALEATPLEARKVLARTRPELKSALKDMMIRSLGRGLGTRRDPFWTQAETLLRAPPTEAEEIYSLLQSTVMEHFGVDLEALRSSRPGLFKSADREARKALEHMTFKPFLVQLSIALANRLLAADHYSRAYNELHASLQSAASPGERLTCTALSCRILEALDSFWVKHFQTPVPDQDRERIGEILLIPYIEARLRSTNPVVFQPYLDPPPISPEEDLHVMNRIHILFTGRGPSIHLSGLQVFFLKEGKADNRYKMTGSLWI